jgi:hypothetical protein
VGFPLGDNWAIGALIYADEKTVKCAIHGRINFEEALRLLHG